MKSSVIEYQNSGSWLLWLQMDDSELLKNCKIDVYKGSGKGGQKKNKTSNAIRLTFAHLVTSSESSRSKGDNINEAIKKMRLEIALDVLGNVQLESRSNGFPSEIQNYLHKPLLRINHKNPHFPIFVAAFIDCYISCSGKWDQVGKKMGTTPSQLRKFAAKYGKIIETLHILDQRFASK